MTGLPATRIAMHEVAPRDGLQMESPPSAVGRAGPRRLRHPLHVDFEQARARAARYDLNVNGRRCRPM